MPLFSRPSGNADAPARPKKTRAKKARPAKPRPMAQDVHVSPFLADHTRAGLADRFNELRERRADSILVSLALGLCLLASLGMNVFQASRSHIQPYMVVVDGTEGYVLDHGPLEPMDTVEEIYVRREIREIISDFRTVTTDRVATGSRFDRAYIHKVVPGSPGDAFLKDFFLRPGNHPNDLAGRGQRTVVEFTGPTPIAGTDTWTVQWIERTAVGAAGVTEDVYRGSLTVHTVPVTDAAMAENNPLGIYIDGIQWEKVSSEYLDLEDLDGETPMDLLYPDGRTTPARQARTTSSATQGAAQTAQPTAQPAQ